MKAAGRGGLVLIMHASEMADGNKWQKKIAKLAIERLARDRHGRRAVLRRQHQVARPVPGGRRGQGPI